MVAAARPPNPYEIQTTRGSQNHSTGAFRSPRPPKKAIAVAANNRTAHVASKGRRGRRGRSPVAQRRSGGATTRAPIASPSHHVVKMSPNFAHGAYPPSERLVTPMVALTIGLTPAARPENRKMSTDRAKAFRPPA